ncbi:colicin E3/pyocin S6 family cytotoxin [Streptacidiphilus jiangxiensis]|uniref:colicin E3/pyocin S6 family cytotoxin n=1 Tax=Streptacidiphilus jiangxiensis TaxID=235985 RepID=UPI00157A5C9D|nr:colicin E3/pyocin S6 family cytotoxin [Streptacidiphilus jiangxiensis]
MSQIAKAFEEAAEKSGKGLAGDFANAYRDILSETKSKATQVAEHAAENEANTASSLAKSAEKDAHSPHVGDPAGPGDGGGGRAADGGGATGPGGERPDPGAGEPRPGQPSEGNGGCTTGGDPVDVVTGQMITSASDLALPGLLPLELRRAYASGYMDGQWLGPGWSSTLDQRVRVDADGISFVGDDAQILHYPLPTDSSSRVLPVRGARWPLTWDGPGGTIRIEDPETGWVRHFDPPPAGGEQQTRALTAMSDRNGHRIEHLYGPEGLPVEVRHSGGYRVAIDTVHTVGGPRLAALRVLDGSDEGRGTRVVGYEWDDRGRLAAVLNSSGLPLVYGWDEQDRITSWTDRNGHWYAYEYGSDGRVARGDGTGGFLAAAFAYDVVQRTTTVTDSLGHATVYAYDAQGHVASVTDALGHVVRTDYDPYGRLLGHADPLGHVTRYTRDSQGRTVRIDHPDGTVTAAEYDTAGFLRVLVEPGGPTWHYECDAQGNRTSVTDPCGAVTRYTYDGQGRTVAETDAHGQTTYYGANSAGLPVSVTDPLGRTTRYERDPFGRLIVETDPLGTVTSYGWTVEGRPAWRQLPDGTREERRHDPEGNLLEHVDAAGHRTRFESGPFGMPTARIDAEGARLAFAYDNEPRLTSVVDAAGREWRYKYSALGDLASETDFNGRTLRYEHDAAGRLVRRTNGANQSITYAWDPVGRVTGHTTDAGAQAAFGYDAAGNLVSARNDWVDVAFRHDACGRVLAEVADGLSFAHGYDLLGRRTERRTPAGVVTAWQYDEAHQATNMMFAGNVVSVDYDRAGREQHRSVGGTTSVSSSWDNRGRLTSQSLTASQASVDGMAPRLLHRSEWTYRADGIAIGHHDSGVGRRSFALDSVGRVTAVEAATWTERYRYDEAGALTDSAAGSQALDVAGGRTYAGAQLRAAGRTSYSYDDQGRVIKVRRRTLSGRVSDWSYRYDAFDRLTDAKNAEGEHWNYVYDALGRRTAKRRLDANGTVVSESRFCWDDEVLAEEGRRSATDSAVTMTTWEYEPGTWIPRAQVRRTAVADDTVSERFWAIIGDLVGTPTHLVTADGHIAWERSGSLWGTDLSLRRSDPEADCPLRFPGQYHDEETGLDYTLHRYYDPQTGRFTAPDPLGLVPAPDPYSYVANPLDEIDPLGLAKRKGSGGGGGNANPAPTPTPAKRTIPTRVPAPTSLPGFPNARKATAKTPVQGGGGKRARWEDGKNIYEWDSQHGEVEKYDKNGRHLGAYDPNTGAQLKGPVSGRKCVK